MSVEQLAGLAARAIAHSEAGARLAEQGWSVAKPLVEAIGDLPGVRSVLNEARPQLSFVEEAVRKLIPEATAPELRPLSRLTGHTTIPAGPFFPNETEWRQLVGSKTFERAYLRKFRRGEMPDLDSIAPARVKALKTLVDSAPGEEGARIWMTGRGLDSYRRNLEIQHEELNSGLRILDLGSGAQQELAEDARKGGYRAIIASVDPGLDLPTRVDLQRLHPSLGKTRSNAEGWYVTPLEYRYEGRLHPKPLTAAHESQLPIKGYDRAYLLYSLPYYGADVEGTLSRVYGLLDPGGVARMYPIRPSQIERIGAWLKNRGIQNVFKHKPEEDFRQQLWSELKDKDADEFRLLSWQKP